MAITKETRTSGECLEDGQIQVKTRTVILEDGAEISSSNHRHVVDVGDDVSGEAQMIQDIAGSVHTPARANARAAVKAAQRANPG
tara:strand:+ start:552 stop:806 length:255 start_codon:yes stop_codon:yes gene_type:complete